MPGRQQIPSFQLPSGTTDERDGSYNLTTVGNIFYNTDTSNVEIRHEDPSNNAAWRDLVVNNREQIDISGYLTLPRQPKLTNQPCFLAYNHPGHDITGSFSNNSVFPFRYTTINVDSCFTTSLDTNSNEHYFTAPVNGIYRFTIKLNIDENNSFNNWRNARPKIRYNGTNSWENIMFERYPPPGAVDDSADILLLRIIPGTSSSLTWLQSLQSGDEIQVQSGSLSTGMWRFDEFMFMGELAFAQ